MKPKEAVEEIVKRWNAGDHYGARKLFFISQWIIPETPREFLKKKIDFHLNIKKKLHPKVIEYCEWFGGYVVDNGVIVYKSKKYERRMEGNSRL